MGLEEFMKITDPTKPIELGTPVTKDELEHLCSLNELTIDRNPAIVARWQYHIWPLLEKLIDKAEEGSKLKTIDTSLLTAKEQMQLVLEHFDEI